jgi:hypothetical protein
MAHPSWPPPAQLLPFKSQIHNNLLPHTLLQRHDRLARGEQGTVAQTSITCTATDQKKLLTKTEQDSLG